MDEEWATVGEVPVRIVRPVGATGALPVVLYVHGAGWVFGNAKTHDRLVRELAVGTGAAVAFPDYGPSPEARYPVALEESYAVRHQVPFYPVTDASFDTPSYHEFAGGYFPRRDAMQWFWDQYTTSQAERAEVTASPLRASAEELTGLPPALVITAEADVLRDEGEAYADKLREAGVPVTAVRHQGVIHDFVVLNALRETRAAEAAIGQAVAVLKDALA